MALWAFSYFYFLFHDLLPMMSKPEYRARKAVNDWY